MLEAVEALKRELEAREVYRRIIKVDRLLMVCTTCPQNDACDYAFDGYNFNDADNGGCLADK